MGLILLANTLLVVLLWRRTSSMKDQSSITSVQDSETSIPSMVVDEVEGDVIPFYEQNLDEQHQLIEELEYVNEQHFLLRHGRLNGPLWVEG